MKKLQLLHNYLLDSGLVEVDQLRTTASDGRITFNVAGAPETNVFFYRAYNAQIIISNFANATDKLDAALVWWLGLYQPNLVGGENGYGFEADIINKETVDLYVVLPLTERVELDINNKEISNCTRPMVLDIGNDAGVFLALFDKVAQEIVDFTNS